MNTISAAGENPLATQDIKKLLLKYAIPATISFLVSSAYNIADQIFIGQGIGMLGNAATNVAFPLSTICTSIFLLIGIGSASNFNLNLGAGNKEKAAHIAGTGITMLAVSGILLSMLVLIFLEPLLIAFGATEQVLPYALTYTKITLLGFPFLIFSSGASQLIRADGSPSYSMNCVLLGAVINIILDPLLIFGFHMGMAGAAIATVIGQVVSCIFVIRYLLKFKTFRIIKEYLKPNKQYIKAIVTLGAAACFNQLAMTAAQIVMNNTLTHYGALSQYGEDIPLACVGVISKVNVVLLAFILGISQGCQPIFGFNYGAKNYPRVKDTFKLAAKTILCITFIAFVSFQLLPRQIISIFGQGNEMYFLFAERYFRIFMFMTFLTGLIPLTSNFFTSIGKAPKGIFISLTRQIIFLVPLVIMLPLFLGIDGVMYAGPISDLAAVIIASILVYLELKQMNRLNSNIIVVINRNGIMTIKKADISDLRTILELQYLAYQSEAKLVNDFSIPPLMQTYDEVEQEYRKGLFLKAVDENGTLVGSVRAYTDQDTAFISKLIVHPDVQGQGIGTKLLSAIEQECSVVRYELFTSNKSVRNLKLYERLGYVRFREENVTADLTFIYLKKLC